MPTPEPPTRAGAVVLAGGRSSRMGTPKATLVYRGQTLLARVVAALAEPLPPAHIVVVRGHGQPPWPLATPVVQVADTEPDAGPLAGLAAGLRALPAECDTLFLTGCDTPLLRPELVAALLKRLHESTADAIVPEVAGRPQPLTAAYRAAITPTVESLLAVNRLSLNALLASLRVEPVPEATLRETDADLASFVNVNTPADFAALPADGG